MHGSLVNVDNQECKSYGYFRRFMYEFPTNGSTQITIHCKISDKFGENSLSTNAGESVTKVEAIIDDVVLRANTYPVVEKPTGAEAVADPSLNSVTIGWDDSTDINVEYFYILRKPKTQSDDAYEKIGEVEAYSTSYTDENFQSGTANDYKYRVVAVDEMATESDPVDLCVNDYDGDGIIDGEDNCPTTYNPDQLDSWPPGGNGCGDACECEGNFDDDHDQDASDAAKFKADFGRSRLSNQCTNEHPCNGDFDCDKDVDSTDAARFKSDYGRSNLSNPCPICVTEPWCVY